ncbi:MAG: hypothetical protein MUC63_01675 [Planctomycetes bacterium]|nr:hypothetical protein [Planctomycetota bacterium]
MSIASRIALAAVLSAFVLALPACPGKVGHLYDKYENKGKSQKELRIAYYEIFQGDVNYPNDDVIIWQDPGRNQRAFLLAPKTRVDVLETVDGDKYGTQHVMYKIKTADGRTGWVPKPWCKQVYK